MRLISPLSCLPPFILTVSHGFCNGVVVGFTVVVLHFFTRKKLFSFSFLFFWDSQSNMQMLFIVLNYTSNHSLNSISFGTLNKFGDFFKTREYRSVQRSLAAQVQLHLQLYM